MPVAYRPRRLRQRRAQCRQQFVLVARQRLPFCRPRCRPVRIHADLHGIAEADERIARETLTTLDTLEQEVRLTAASGQVTTVVPVYAGLSGFPGLSQIVFQIPDVANGDYQLVLSVSGQASPNGAYIPISR